MPVYTNAGGGGGLDTDYLTATAADVLKGKTAGVKECDEPVTGTLDLTGDAADSTVLVGKTYYNTDARTKRTGTMGNQGTKTATLNCGDSYTIPAGYHNGAGKITANTLASQTSGTASAGNILSGKTAWVNGTKITGNIASLGAQTVVPGNTQKAVSCSGKYMTGNVTVSAVSNLTPGNIKKGVTVGGIIGTFEGYVPTSTDLYLRGNNIYNWTSTYKGVTFDAGQINFTDEFLTGASETINLTGYTKVIIEGNITVRGGTSATQYGMRLSDHLNAEKLIVEKTENIGTETKTFTYIELDISNRGIIIKPNLWFYTHNGGSSSKSYGYITRIRIA